MADILIRTDMPEYCYECPCHNGESGYCQAYKSGYLYSIERPAKCPINPLPEGHGRLGDLDEIVKRLNEMEADFDKKGFHQGACWVHVIAELLRKAPTIVPPEPPKEKTNETPSKPKRGSQRKTQKTNSDKSHFPIIAGATVKVKKAGRGEEAVKCGRLDNG